MKRRIIQITLAVLIAGGGLALALRGLDFAAVTEALRQARRGWLLVTLVLLWFVLIARAARWRLLLGCHVSLGDAFGLTNIGYLVNNLLPMRLGDAAKAVAAGLRSDGNLSPLAALSTVVVERVLDLLTIVLLMIATLPFIVAGSLDNYRTGGLLSGAVALGLCIALVLAARYPEFWEKLAGRVFVFLHLPAADRWQARVGELLEGLAPLRSLRGGVQLAGWSLVLWGLVVIGFQTLLYAFLPAPPALAGAVITWAAALGMMFPAPGGIGPYHAAVIQALTRVFDVPLAQAQAYAFVAHALSYLLGVILGAAALLRWGLSFRQVVRQAQTLEAAEVESGR